MLHDLDHYGFHDAHWGGWLKGSDENMNEYKRGDKITVTFTGTIRETGSKDACAKVTDDSDCEFNHYVYLNSSAVEITRAEPDNWPPQVGDIWEVAGNEYSVRRNSASPEQLVIQLLDIDESTSRWEYYKDNQDKFKALNPRLIRRREG